MHDLSADSDRTVDGLKIGYVGGGSRSWATTLMNDLAQAPDLHGRVALYDVDHESARRNAELGEWVQSHDDAVGEWTYEAVESLGAALEDADFVILSTQDPPAETMAHDLDVPAEYGIYQTVGDTVGPGGALRAMRAVPQYREIAATIRERCPDAWVINYTNPMTVCTRTLYEEFPDINAVGLCHEVFKAQELFAELVEEHFDADDVRRSEIDVNVKGINHFTWVDDAHWRGENVFELLELWSEDKPAVPHHDPGDFEDASFYVDNNDVTVDLLGDHADELTPPVRRSFEAAGDVTLREFKRADLTRTAALDGVVDVFESADLLVTPTLGIPWIRNRRDGLTTEPTTADGEPIESRWNLTGVFNWTGHPAASVPAGFVDGHPIGMQIVGPRYDDETVLAASGAVERVRPWHGSYPPR